MTASLDPQPFALERRRRRPPAWAVVTSATIGAGILWMVLSIATGLIFHFMPGAPILTAVWVQRAYGPDAPIPRAFPSGTHRRRYRRHCPDRDHDREGGRRVGRGVADRRRGVRRNGARELAGPTPSR